MGLPEREGERVLSKILDLIPQTRINRGFFAGFENFFGRRGCVALTDPTHESQTKYPVLYYHRGGLKLKILYYQSIKKE
jgi:hypothetical protein